MTFSVICDEIFCSSTACSAFPNLRANGYILSQTSFKNMASHTLSPLPLPPISPNESFQSPSFISGRPCAPNSHALKMLFMQCSYTVPSELERLNKSYRRRSPSLSASPARYGTDTEKISVSLVFSEYTAAARGSHSMSSEQCVRTPFLPTDGIRWNQ